MRDSGPGIAEEELERILVPFHGGQTSQRFAQGTGLGLTIAPEVVRLRGAVYAISKLVMFCYGQHAVPYAIIIENQFDGKV